MKLLSELRRRNVLRMAAFYLGAAWLILQVVDLLIDRGPLPDSLGPITLTVLVIGFPIAVVLSWLYELTPEGVTRDDAGRSSATASGDGRRLDFIVIAVLAAAVLMFAWDKWWTASPSERSVAVLPFLAMSSGENDGYLADGLTEEILNALTQLPELKVTARTSSFFFKGKDIPVPEIADILGVAHIVEGSVRRDGDRLRVTSQLIRAADGFHVWSQTYDRVSADVFAIQQDIAEKVAESLDVVLDDEALERMSAMRINDVEAFIAYQKGRDLYDKAHFGDVPFFEGLAQANEYFDQALEAQPDLYAVRILKSDRVGHLKNEAIESGDSDYAKVKELQEAQQMELDLARRSLPDGNQRDILDLEIKLVSDDWTGLSVLIQRAMQPGTPGTCPRMNLAEAYLPRLGFALESARKLEEWLACDPLDAYTFHHLGDAYVFAGRPDDALDVLDRAEATGVLSAGDNQHTRFRALALAGRFDDPLVQDVLNSPTRFTSLLRALIQGNQAEAQRIAEQFWANSDISPAFSLMIATLVGDRARANEFAARLDDHPLGIFYLPDSIEICLIWGRPGVAKGCRNGGAFDLEATPNFKARIEASGLPWPPLAYRDIN